MLAQMRAMAQGWIAKILLGLLIVAFAIWGITGVFDGVRNSDAASVAGRSISIQRVERELNLVLESQRDAEQPMTRADAIARNVPTQILEGLITQQAMQAFAQRLGVQAADSDVSRAISEIPAVQDEQNRFQQAIYERFLAKVGYGHAEFVEMMRGNVAVQQMMLALTAGARAPRSYGALMLAFQSETRVVSVAQINIAQLGAVPAPTEEQLRALYGELRSSPQMRVPEYRRLTLVVADPATFAARAEVPEQDIRDLFEQRAAALGTPERRSFTIITTRSQEDAAAAAQRLARGEEAAAIARAMNAQTITYDTQAQAEIPDADLARAVFALPQNAVPQVVRGSLSPFAAVRLIDVAPGVAARLEDFREEIRAALANDRGNQLREEAIETFNDRVGEGVNPADAARAAGLSVIVVPAINEGGAAPDGSRPEAPLTPALLSTAFQAEEGEDTDFIPIPGGVEVFVHVTAVTPATVRAFEEVQDGLVAEWSRRERARRLDAAAGRIVTAVNAGTPLADAARAERAQVTVRSQRIDRAAAERLLPDIFTARMGEAVKAVSADARQAIVAQVEAIDRQDPEEQQQEVEQMRQFLQGGEIGVVRSLAEAVQTAAVAAGNPRRNEELMRRTFPNPQDAQEQ